jgi:hypothetical protein
MGAHQPPLTSSRLHRPVLYSSAPGDCADDTDLARPLALLVASAVLGLLAAWLVSVLILGVRVPWLLLPMQDMLGFTFWIAGFFGRSVMWRGQRYRLNGDGTVMPA